MISPVSVPDANEPTVAIIPPVEPPGEPPVVKTAVPDEPEAPPADVDAFNWPDDADAPTPDCIVTFPPVTSVDKPELIEILPPLDGPPFPAATLMDDEEPDTDVPTDILIEPVLAFTAVPDCISTRPLDALEPAAADCNMKSPELEEVPTPRFN